MVDEPLISLHLLLYPSFAHKPPHHFILSLFAVDSALHTPSRFLLNCFSELTPSFGERYGFEETNPFEQSFNEDVRSREKHITINSKDMDVTNAGLSSYPSPVSPPTSTNSSDAGSEPLSSPVKPTKSISANKATVFKSQGPENFEPGNGSRASKYKTLKHKLSTDEDEDEEDLELKRLRFLERNRQAGMFIWIYQYTKSSFVLLGTIY